MNDDSFNSCKVVSEYFAGSSVMDDSLTDFQEKKTFQESKKAKATTSKPKAKKAVKRIKGQKDIRTALKPKKNELIAYSKDFENVCRKSGIDVDSEQLQLAIALSKSLQPTTESPDNPGTSQSLNLQQRTGLIRTTLKEYGFKIPEPKPSVSRKTKRRRKPYKLLLTSIEQKQQIISDKYSQLLFELNNTKTSSNPNLDVSNLFIYNMSTNVEYECIKEDDIFYVDNLLEKSPNNMGCLLKNWSEIPGRPLSPTRDESEIIFSEIECSQDEIDIVLSGSLKHSRDILIRRNLYKRKSADHAKIDVADETHQESNINIVKECKDINLTPEIVTISSASNNESEDAQIKVTFIQDKLLTVTQTSRSLSPDLFEDYEDTIPENHTEIVKEIPGKSTCNVTKETSDVMDLTECVNVISQKGVNKYLNLKPPSQLSQEVDATKRKSNDFMEITECVGVSYGPVLEIIDEHVDLTLNCPNESIIEKNRISNESVEHMDLTQSSNSSNDTLPAVHISGKDKSLPDESTDNTILLNDIDYLQIKAPNTNTETNTVDINDKNAEHDEENTTEHDDALKIDFPVKSIDVPNDASIINSDDTSEIGVAEDEIDLTQSNSNEAENTTKHDDLLNIDSPIKSIEMPKDASIINLDESCETGVAEDEIDLTQSNSNEAENADAFNVTNHITNYSKLGKKDDVSVDYDEALENMNSCSYYEISDYETELAQERSETSIAQVNPNFSNHSEIPKVPNKEMSTSKDAIVENRFEFGGISIIENMPSFTKSRSTITSTANASLVNDSLPTVDIKGKAAKPKSPCKDAYPVLDPIEATNSNNKVISISQTPCKRFSTEANIETPKQTEYIIKTDNVTPMLDYAALSTPERNKELDKYGLKPFKRKRAIQLLTHLYNQTHPYVESTEELTSPSKKRKHDSSSQPCTSKSPKKRTKSPINNCKSPRKVNKSPRKVPEDTGSNTSDKENDMFMVTNEVPSIRDIECSSEDWVFQKREKAKVHSCRVPLHIAFHNFVSSRQRLHEAILRYEPVNIDVIHKELAANGHRYDPKDLLKFMDKKCITVKTADNTKNKNRY